MVAQRLKASLVLCNVPTKKSEDARRFYSALLGSEDFVRAPSDEESYFMPISDDGIDMTITQRYDDREGLVCYFAVPDLGAAIAELKGLGGEVVVEPHKVQYAAARAKKFKKRFGDEFNPNVATMAVMLDPDKNHVGLMELEEHAHQHFRVGKHKRKLDEDQVKGHAKARKLAKEEDLD